MHLLIGIGFIAIALILVIAGVMSYLTRPGKARARHRRQEPAEPGERGEEDCE
jgi:hypothetical protein